MIKYVSIRSALRFIPKPLFDMSSELDFLSWMLDAYRQLKLPSTYESKIQFIEIIDNKAILPSDIKEIRAITYLSSEPSNSDVSSFTDCICNSESISTDEDTNDICDYTIAYKQFLDSPYYKNNFTPLQFKGNYGSTLFCESCPNRFSTCQNYFTVDKNNVLHTNLCDGFLCIDYYTEMKDEDGNFLIVDLTEVKQFLAHYAIAKHWEERAAGKEDGAQRLSESALVKAEIYFNKCRGLLIMRDISINDVASLQYGGYQHYLKIPERYVYSR